MIIHEVFSSSVENVQIIEIAVSFKVTVKKFMELLTYVDLMT